MYKRIDFSYGERNKGFTQRDDMEETQKGMSYCSNFDARYDGTLATRIGSKKILQLTATSIGINYTEIISVANKSITGYVAEQIQTEIQPLTKEFPDVVVNATQNDNFVLPVITLQSKTFIPEDTTTTPTTPAFYRYKFYIVSKGSSLQDLQFKVPNTDPLLPSTYYLLNYTLTGGELTSIADYETIEDLDFTGITCETTEAPYSYSYSFVINNRGSNINISAIELDGHPLTFTESNYGLDSIDSFDNPTYLDVNKLVFTSTFNPDNTWSFTKNGIPVNIATTQLSVTDVLGITRDNAWQQEIKITYLAQQPITNNNINIFPLYINKDKYFLFVCYNTKIDIYDKNYNLHTTINIVINNLNELKSCYFDSQIILTNKNQKPIIIQYNNNTNTFSQLPNDIVCYTDFEKESYTQWYNMRMQFTKPSGSAVVTTPYNDFFNSSHLMQRITDGVASFRITKIYGSRKAEGYWIINSPDLSTLTDTQTIWENKQWRLQIGTALSVSNERGYFNCLANFNQSLWFGGTKDKPLTIWKSKAGNYFDFYEGTNQPADAKQYNIDYPEVDEIVCIFRNKGLQVFTERSEFYIPEDASSVQPIGTSGIRKSCNPIVLGLSTIYISSNGKHLFYLKQNQLNPSMTEASRNLTLDCNSTLNDALQITARKNEEYGSEVFIVNGDGTMSKAIALISEEGEKFAFSRYTIQNTNIICQTNIKNNIYLLNNKGELTIIDGEEIYSDYQQSYNNYLGEEIDVFTNGEYLVESGTSREYVSVNNFKLVSTLRGDIKYGLSIESEFKTFNIIDNHQQTNQCGLIKLEIEKKNGYDNNLKLNNQNYSFLQNITNNTYEYNNVDFYNSNSKLEIKTKCPILLKKTTIKMNIGTTMI